MRNSNTSRSSNDSSPKTGIEGSSITQCQGFSPGWFGGTSLSILAEMDLPGSSTTPGSVPIVIGMVIHAHRQFVESKAGAEFISSTHRKIVCPILIGREEGAREVRHESTLVLLSQNLLTIFVHHFQDTGVYQMPINIIQMSTKPCRLPPRRTPSGSSARLCSARRALPRS